MAWLTINGIEFSVEVGSTDWTQDLEPTRARTVTGEAYEDPVADKGGWSFRARLGSPEERRALRRYLVGATNGHVWDAEGATDAESKFSSKGLGLIDSSDISQSIDEKFGDHGFDPSASDVSILTLAEFDAWTVAAWATTDNWSTGDHYLQTSDDHRWENGSRNDSVALPWTTPETSISTDYWGLKVKDPTDDTRFDELLFFPFVWPDRWPTELDLTTAHSKLPHLEIAGDFHDKSPITASLAGTPTVAYPDTGGDQQAAIDFALREV